MKKRKKQMAWLFLTCMAIMFLPMTAFAKDVKLSFKASTSGSGNTIKVRSIEYDNDTKNGLAELDVDFSQRVTWKKTAKIVSVKNEKGTSFDAYLRSKDNDDCEIAIENLTEGHTYTIVINGIKKRGTSGYRKLTLKVEIPATKKASKVKVKKVEVDDDNDDDDSYQTEIDIKFTSKVTWKRTAKVKSVKDSSGKSYKGYLTDKDDDDCEVYIKNIKYGKTYTIKISGVKTRGASSYETITVKVKVPKRSTALKVKEVEYDVDDDYYYDDDDDYDDYDDDEPSAYSVKFDFNKDVLFKSSSYVVIKDSSGKKYSTKSSYLDWDDDECEVYLSKELKYGKTYQYTIYNVKAVGGSYTTLKGSFVAR